MMTNYKNIDLLLRHCRLILASGSPRRVRLLKDVKIPFRQIVPEIDESNFNHSNPYELAVHLAEQKARVIMSRINPGDVVLGCDTIVVLKGRLMGKPLSADEAVKMLIQLSGNMHTVCSAVALLTREGDFISGYELSNVFFKKVSIDRIKQYVETGEPMDKAGSYGIQDRGVFLVDRVEGNIDNVIGLPLALLDEFAGKLAIIKGLTGV